MKRRAWISAFGAGCLLGLTGLGCSGANAPRSQFGSGLATVTASEPIRKQEHRMFALLNRDRAQAGLPRLKYDEQLADVARYHSKDMRDHGFFEHESPTSGSLEDRLNAAGYLFLTARENLSEAPDVEQSQQNLMNSPPHHQNIMSKDVTHLGVGVIEGGVRDARNLTITQVFARPGRVETTEQARSGIVEQLRAARRAEGLPALKPHSALQALCERWVDELGSDASAERVERIGEQVSEAVAAERLEGVNGVLTGGQLLPDSQHLRIPGPVLTPQATSIGVAVRQVEGEGGRPMLALLLLVGMR